MRKVELLPTLDCEAGYSPGLYLTLRNVILRNVQLYIFSF